MSRAARRLPLYLSAPHACSYLEGRTSNTLFTDPEQPMTMETYSELLQLGFRRSGSMIYAPRCENCRQCISVRLPVVDFVPRRNQRRVIKMNQDIELIGRPAGLDAEHYALYRRYMRARHDDGEMANASPADYLGFLTADWCATEFLEMRLGDRLVGVAVTDRPDDGLSAVYTFFDPGLASRSLGTFGVLSQIRRAQSRGLSYLYLGFWIRDSRKMAYKLNFRPIELWRDGRWQTLKAGEPG